MFSFIILDSREYYASAIMIVGGLIMSEKVKKNIKLDDLKFDARNPRLPMRLQGITDESKVIDYMVKYGNIVELMLSIAETGYSDAEPLLVVGEFKDNYIVVEGNRRLAALKLLNNPELAKVRSQSIKDVIANAIYIPREIPCILYPRREDVLDYLGYRHITGVKDWGALEKARYLEQLYQIHIVNTEPNKIYTKLAKMIGSRADYVSKLHLALKLYDKANDSAYYGADIKEENISFSWLTTALGYSGIVSFIGLSSASDASIETLNEENFEKLFTWMFFPGKMVIKESRQISELAKIIESSVALERLENGSSIDEALLYTSAPCEAFIEMLRKAKQQLKQAKDAIEQLSEEPQEAKELIEDIDRLLKTISGALKENFKKSEENSTIIEQLTSDPDTLARLIKLLGK